MADLLGLKHQNDKVTVLPKREYITWTTFEGETKRICDLEDQHLCNIYYFIEYLNPEFYDAKTKLLIRCEIDKRFDGNPLEYRPLKRFINEIEFLKQKGWLVKDEQEKRTYVVIDGKKIGEVSEE